MPEDEKGGQGADPTQAFQNRLAKMNGDAMAFATQLFDENFRLRNDKRELEARVPAEGSVVLTKADAERWEKFKALGKKPDELETIIREHGDSATEVNRLKRKDALREVAEVGFGGSRLKLSVLEKLDGEFGEDPPEYTIKDDGKGGKAVLVKHGGKETPLEKFAAESWADFVPALKAGQGSQGASRGNGGDPPPAGASNVYERAKEAGKASAATGSVGGAEWLGKRFGGAASNA